MILLYLFTIDVDLPTLYRHVYHAHIGGHMKIAFISDIHGNLPALEAVKKDILRRGVDQIVNLGDSLSGPLLPRETAQFLMAEGWYSLAGNHERQILTEDGSPRGLSDAYAYEQLTQVELDWIRSLTHRHQLTNEILICHGTPRKDIEYFLETVEGNVMHIARPDEINERIAGEMAPIIVCGHSHTPRMIKRHARQSNEQVLFNPGSVGLQAYDDNHPHYYRMEMGSPDARYAILELHQGQWSGSFYSVAYNFESMVQLAKQRGREDWARALQTGYA